MIGSASGRSSPGQPVCPGRGIHVLPGRRAAGAAAPGRPDPVLRTFADGRLFGSVTAQDIASAIREARGLRLDKRNVHLPEPIKNVGTYMVVVDVVEGVQATIKTMVVAKK